MRTIIRDEHNHPIALRSEFGADDIEINVDPYGSLEFGIGGQEDFYCLDYCVEWMHERSTEQPKLLVYLRSVINSESGHFIMDGSVDEVIIDVAALDPGYTESEGRVGAVAGRAARDMVFEALDWCVENDIRHDRSGWNQDPMRFARCVIRAALLAVKPLWLGPTEEILIQFGNPGRGSARVMSNRMERFGSKRLDRIVSEYLA